MKILIADDHEIVLRGIRQILMEEFPNAYIDEAVDTDTLIAKAINDKWDIAISDLSMPGGGGIEALKIIQEKKPGLPVLIFSSYPEDQYALRVIKAGAHGFLNKDKAPEELAKAIRQVLEGKKYISNAIAEKIAMSLSGPVETLPHQLLSKRELSIFIMLASGKPITEIATTLSIATTTASTYRSRILDKLNMKTNAQLTQYV
ncbi:MAG: response regulator transcription factor, partial [Bacteroidia bacterium]|nr:response regulator transcription factor [Bacteroidia bacterium]